ncbi:hypothetical protein CFC21_096168 [Triticum aestivum]|uniref:Uncharacterized protein n=3 Tax=Triticum TaxID=4564 RepID=A0A9R0Z5N6_TRITD|nr:hypothetical protein CFC21_096168 [Triticum aestivum]VAI70480.1 unnamed protein product [Triticum turgidum subsp. durum]
MSFFDSTPIGRILSRGKKSLKQMTDMVITVLFHIHFLMMDYPLQVSSDLSIIDLDVPFAFMFTFSASLTTYSNLVVLAVVTWQVLFVSSPMIVLAIRLQMFSHNSD